jgi:peptide/nickel transport system permease protein
VRRLIGRRLSLLLPVLFGLSLLVFLWIHALPGGPGAALLGEHSTPAAIAQINRAYGLDQPVIVQYWDFLGQAVHLQFGNSVMTGVPVITEIRQAFPATIELSVAALIFAIGLGIPLGYLMARRFGSKFDQVSMGLSLLGISVPIFFLGYLLKYVFAVRLGWLPSDGRLNPTDLVAHPTGFYVLDGIIDGSPAAVWDAVRHLILPAITLGSIPLAIVIRITRAAVLDVINEDHVRTARSMGLRPRPIRARYILRNAMAPISTTIGLQVGLLLSGAVLTETVYAWNGMGTLLYQAILNRDFPVLEGGILLLAVIFVLVNLVVDVSYAFLDPRVRMR